MGLTLYVDGVGNVGDTPGSGFAVDKGLNVPKRLYAISVLFSRQTHHGSMDIINDMSVELSDESVDALKMKAIRTGIAAYKGYALMGEPNVIEITRDQARSLLLRDEDNCVVHGGGKDD